MTEDVHLRVYRFDPGAVFEGGLLAAVERMQVGKDGAPLDALFVRRDAGSGALEAIALGVGGADATLASLLDFRLDSRRRRALTERTLAEHPDGVPQSVIEAIADTLEAGAAILAMLQPGPAASVLEEAVARSGGRSIADEPVDARALAQVSPRLRAAVGSPPPST
jgi:hypothetical protein